MIKCWAKFWTLFCNWYLYQLVVKTFIWTSTSLGKGLCWTHRTWFTMVRSSASIETWAAAAHNHPPTPKPVSTKTPALHCNYRSFAMTKFWSHRETKNHSRVQRIACVPVSRSLTSKYQLWKLGMKDDNIKQVLGLMTLEEEEISKQKKALLWKAKQTGDAAWMWVNVLHSCITQAAKPHLEFIIEKDTACFDITAAKNRHNPNFCWVRQFMICSPLHFQ